MPEQKKKGFVHMELAEANKHCRPYNVDGAIVRKCEECSMKVILHCADCQLQISGCLCTEIENHGEVHARERMKNRGIWLPEWGEAPQGLLDANGKRIDGGN